MLPAARPALLLEAIVTVNWFVTARQEWHFGLLAAVGACHGVHLALAAEAATPAAAATATAAPAAASAATIASASAVAITIAVPAAAVAIPLTVAAAASATALLARLPAGRTTRGLIRETLLRVELLLTRREDELRATVPARQRFVSVAHR